MSTITVEDLLAHIEQLTATAEREKVEQILAVVDQLSTNVLTQEQRDKVTSKHRLVIDLHLAKAIPELEALCFVIASPAVPRGTMYLLAGDDRSSVYWKPGVVGDSV